MIRWLLYWRGRIRIRSGRCPFCNSSPPSLDCPICEGTPDYGKDLDDGEKYAWQMKWTQIFRVLK